MVSEATTKFGAHVLQRLSDAQVIWLTTVGADGTPQPNPVWFLWENDSFLIYTQPISHKLRHITRSPKVSLNFDSVDEGGDIVVFTGEAKIEESVSPAAQAAYLEKYKESIVAINLTFETMLRTYSTIIRVTPKKVRGL